VLQVAAPAVPSAGLPSLRWRERALTHLSRVPRRSTAAGQLLRAPGSAWRPASPVRPATGRRRSCWRSEAQHTFSRACRVRQRGPSRSVCAWPSNRVATRRLRSSRAATLGLCVDTWAVGTQGPSARCDEVRRGDWRCCATTAHASPIWSAHTFAPHSRRPLHSTPLVARLEVQVPQAALRRRAARKHSSKRLLRCGASSYAPTHLKPLRRRRR